MDIYGPQKIIDILGDKYYVEYFQLPNLIMEHNNISQLREKYGNLQPCHPIYLIPSQTEKLILKRSLK